MLKSCLEMLRQPAHEWADEVWNFQERKGIRLDLDRRQMLRLAAAGAASFLATEGHAAADFPIEHGIPRVDYHAHIGEGISVDDAIAIAHKRRLKFGLLQHAGSDGHGYAVSNDDELDRWLRSLEGKPVYKGIEAEGLDWVASFSKSALAKVDYIQSDPLAMPDETGAPMRLWSADFRCDNPQKFMDRYADFHVELISTKPIDILAVPTFLPDVLRVDYDRLWNNRRTQIVIDAAIKFNVALEIDTRFRVPGIRFLQTAKAAGAKFSFGSNYQTLEGLGDIRYTVEMYRKVGLALDHFFRPAPPGKKPIEVRS